jgi:histidinol-phosphatase
VADDLAYALELADLADSLTLPRFRALDLRVDTKPDLTPVSDADRAVEEAIRARVAKDRDGEGVLGEEYGDDGTAARWIVDPIDGTRNYVRGVPVWGTLIALERDGELRVAVASAPALGRRWWASRGGGAFADGDPIQVSAIARLEDAVWSGVPAPRDVWHSRDLGDFWQHVLVAEGAVDVAAEPSLRVWDFAAIRLIVEEAGGRCTRFDGAPPTDGGSVVSTNGLLHDAARQAAAASASS